MAPRSRRAFTLVEALVVIGVLAVLLSMLIPVIGKVRDAALATQCSSNLRQIQLAFNSYLGENDNIIPYSSQSGNAWNPMNVTYNYAYSHLSPLPWPVDKPIDDPRVCPAAIRRWTPYYGYPFIYTANGGWRYDVRTSGGENDLMNGLRKWTDVRRPDVYPFFMDVSVGVWGPGYSGYPTAPNSIYGDPKWQGVGAHHAGGRRANVAYADGHVSSVVRDEVYQNNTQRFFENR